MSVAPSVQTRIAWLVVILLFCGSVLNYVDRAALSIVKTDVCRELDLSNEDYGQAMTAFLISYMILYILGGRLADRLGCRRTFLLTVVFWSLANMLHAVARGLGTLSLYRALLGLGEGGYYPTAMRGAAEWLPSKQRALAVSLFLCGLCVGTMATPWLVAQITLYHGWRAAFLVTGAMGFLLLPPWLLLHWYVKKVYGTMDPAPYYQAANLGAAGGEDDLSVPEVLRRRKYWCLLFARALTDGAWWFYLFWIPSYFREIRRFDLETIGRILWIPYLFADIGSLAGGLASSWLIHRGLGINVARKCILIPSALLAALGGFTYFVAEPSLAVALVSIALFGHLSWATNIHTAISEVVPLRHVAVLYGTTGAVGTLMGALTQTYIGRAIDTIGYAPVFVVVGGVYLLAIVLLLAAGRIERLRRPAPAMEAIIASDPCTDASRG